MTNTFNIFFLIVSICFSIKAYSLGQKATKKYLVIVTSSPEYQIIKQGAKLASKQLNIKLDLRFLEPNKQTGLTQDQKSCVEGPTREFPCYPARGKTGEGEAISIEYSSAYKEMNPKLYIVVAYAGDKNGADAALSKIKPKYKDAYIKAVQF